VASREQAWRQVAAQFHAAGLDQPQLDARLLLMAATGIDETELIIAGGEPILPAESRLLDEMAARRLAHEPVSRILGLREFWGLPFGLNAATLDPRPDSETIVETALRYLPDERATILDLGTGTGCLLLALLSERPCASGLGIDIAPLAVEQARANAADIGLAAQAQFRCGNWHEDISSHFDMVISNPPYIPQADIERLAPEVRLHDPLLALDGGDDGLAAYRILAKAMPGLLRAEGHCVVEFGQGQQAAVSTLFQGAGLEILEMVPDLAGILRVVVARLPRDQARSCDVIKKVWNEPI